MRDLFVGNACGDVGLSAINIARLVVCVLQSLETGIGTGGASFAMIVQDKSKSLETCFYNVYNHFATERNISTVPHNGGICDALDHVLCYAELAQIHNQAKLIHP